MRIGILVTGHVAGDLVPKHGAYPAMFEAWLGSALPEASFKSWMAIDDTFPGSPNDADAWLVTGSRHGVYEDLPWIRQLIGFLRDAREAERPVVGICFGHQALAMAWGGHAEKSDRGWGVGVARYGVTRRPSWMADAKDELAFHAMHQDQVTAVPDDATVLAASDHCPFAMLAYGDPERPDGISIQPHPEFSEGYARDLVDVRRGLSFDDATADRAMETYGCPTDADSTARWVAAYLRSVVAERNAA